MWRDWSYCVELPKQQETSWFGRQRNGWPSWRFERERCLLTGKIGAPSELVQMHLCIQLWVLCSYAEARASWANCDSDAIKASTRAAFSLWGLVSGDFRPHFWRASSPKCAEACWLRIDVNGTRNGAWNRELQPAMYFCRFRVSTVFDMWQVHKVCRTHGDLEQAVWSSLDSEQWSLKPLNFMNSRGFWAWFVLEDTC